MERRERERDRVLQNRMFMCAVGAKGFRGCIINDIEATFSSGKTLGFSPSDLKHKEIQNIRAMTQNAATK
jgi:hypothetical protein